MSDSDDNGTTATSAWRGKAIAEQIMDTYSAALDTHEGVFLALQIAYGEGVNDGSASTLDALRRQLATL